MCRRMSSRNLTALEWRVSRLPRLEHMFVLALYPRTVKLVTRSCLLRMAGVLRRVLLAHTETRRDTVRCAIQPVETLNARGHVQSLHHHMH
jgi:hypothetical protein